MKAPDSEHIIAKISDFGIYTSVEPNKFNLAWIAPELLRDKDRVILLLFKHIFNSI
jgi:hypothetical protein